MIHTVYVVIGVVEEEPEEIYHDWSSWDKLVYCLTSEEARKVNDNLSELKRNPREVADKDVQDIGMSKDEILYALSNYDRFCIITE